MKHAQLIAPSLLILPWIGVEVLRSKQPTGALDILAIVLLSVGLTLPIATTLAFVKPCPKANAWVVGIWLALGFKIIWNFMERASSFWDPIEHGLDLLTLGVALVLTKRATTTLTRSSRARRILRLVSSTLVIVAVATLMHLDPDWFVWARRVAFCLFLFEFARWLAQPSRPILVYWVLALGSISLLEQLDPIYREQSVWLAGMYLLCATIRLRADFSWVGCLSARTTMLTLLASGAALLAANLLIARDRSALNFLEERGIAQVALNVAFTLSDFDRDGHGVLFGQTDCAPFDTGRSPGSHERRDTPEDDNCQQQRDGSIFGAWLRVNEAPRPITGDAVLIVIDSLRYDTSLSDRLKSLRTFERGAVRYERAYATSSYTVQSIFSILTGGLPPQTSYRWKSRHLSQPSRIPETLFERAAARGFDTGAAGVVRQVLDGFTRGARVVQKSELGAMPQATEEQAVEVWKALDPQGPRFLYVHYIHLHNHLRPGRPLDFEELRENYMKHASEVDVSLGRLLARLPADATIIVTSDHGESFGSHGRVGHSIELSEELLHVPLYVSVPGVPPRRERRVTSLLSLSPTIDALTAKARPTSPGFYFCIDQEPCSSMHAPAALERRSVHRHSVVVDQRRVTRDVRTGRGLLFDLKRDPAALHPVDATSEIKAELIAWEEFGMDPSAPPVAFSPTHASR